LEQQWEAKLAAQQQLAEAYHRFRQEHPRTLSEAERTAIRQLAADIPALGRRRPPRPPIARNSCDRSWTAW